MKKYDIIDLVDEQKFRSEVMADFPMNWEADLHYKDGSYYLSVTDIAKEKIETIFKANNIRYIRMNIEEREYNGFKVTIAEDNQFYYINFNTGLGDGIYDKTEWKLDAALENQANLYKENG